MMSGWRAIWACALGVTLAGCSGAPETPDARGVGQGGADTAVVDALRRRFDLPEQVAVRAMPAPTGPLGYAPPACPLEYEIVVARTAQNRAPGLELRVNRGTLRWTPTTQGAQISRRRMEGYSARDDVLSMAWARGSNGSVPLEVRLEGAQARDVNPAAQAYISPGRRLPVWPVARAEALPARFETPARDAMFPARTVQVRGWFGVAQQRAVWLDASTARCAHDLLMTARGEVIAERYDCQAHDLPRYELRRLRRRCEQALLPPIATDVTARVAEAIRFDALAGWLDALRQGKTAAVQEAFAGAAAPAPDAITPTSPLATFARAFDPVADAQLTTMHTDDRGRAMRVVLLQRGQQRGKEPIWMLELLWAREGERWHLEGGVLTHYPLQGAPQLQWRHTPATAAP